MSGGDAVTKSGSLNVQIRTIIVTLVVITSQNISSNNSMIRAIIVIVVVLTANPNGSAVAYANCTCWRVGPSSPRTTNMAVCASKATLQTSHGGHHWTFDASPSAHSVPQYRVQNICSVNSAPNPKPQPLKP